MVRDERITCIWAGVGCINECDGHSKDCKITLYHIKNFGMKLAKTDILTMFGFLVL